MTPINWYALSRAPITFFNEQILPRVVENKVVIIALLAIGLFALVVMKLKSGRVQGKVLKNKVAPLPHMHPERKGVIDDKAAAIEQKLENLAKDKTAAEQHAKELKAQLDRLKESHDQAESKLKTQEDEIGKIKVSLNKKLEAMKEECSQKMAVVQSPTKKDSEQQIAKLEARLEAKHELRIQELEENLEILESQKAAAEQQTKELEAQIDGLKESLQQAESKIETLSLENDKVNEQVQQVQHERDGLHAKAAQLEEKEKSIARQAQSSLTEVRKGYEEKVKALMSEKQRLEEQLKATSNEGNKEDTALLGEIKNLLSKKTKEINAMSSRTLKHEETRKLYNFMLLANELRIMAKKKPEELKEYKSTKKIAEVGAITLCFNTLWESNVTKENEIQRIRKSEERLNERVRQLDERNQQLQNRLKEETARANGAEDRSLQLASSKVEK